jgi:hypothetical protein
VRSHNLAYHELALVDPPPGLPAWLPLLAEAGQPPELPLLAPARVVLAPNAAVSVPVGISLSWLAGAQVVYAGRSLPAEATGTGHAALRLPVRAPAGVGEVRRLIQVRPTAPGTSRWLSLTLAVREPAETSASRGVALINPSFVSPANWSSHKAPPRLCWQVPAAAGAQVFRVMLAGPTPAESGWTAENCWRAPALAPGHYAWKVFVRDAQGYMNRTNQRPYVFSIR